MPVLIEMTSLVAPADRLGQALGSKANSRALGAVGQADDGEIVAMSFECHEHLHRALRQLERAGLVPVRGGEPAEVAIVDQLGGPALWWPWVELAVVQLPQGGRVLAARRAGDRRGSDVAVPPTWSFRRSASETFGAGTLATADRPLRHVRREHGCDLYVDRWTGADVRVARTHAPVRVSVEGPGGGRGEVDAELVSGREEVEVGLMFRDSLGPDCGMLFRFEGPEPHGFWMKNTHMPLDILFVDACGTVLNVVEQAEPLRLAMHCSAGPVVEVLEVPGGWSAAHGVGAGAQLSVMNPATPPGGPGTGPAPRPSARASRAR
jgi:uncharacterized membrane protein (UPF0127 family)